MAGDSKSLCSLALGLLPMDVLSFPSRAAYPGHSPHARPSSPPPPPGPFSGAPGSRRTRGLLPPKRGSTGTGPALTFGSRRARALACPCLRPSDLRRPPVMFPSVPWWCPRDVSQRHLVGSPSVPACCPGKAPQWCLGCAPGGPLMSSSVFRRCLPVVCPSVPR